MIRLHYLVPRLVILALLMVLVWISADPLLKYAIVKSTESVTGAKVDVGQVKASLLEGKVYISDLAITDPRDPMRNLLQADVAYLKMDPRRLLHKELIVEHGHSKQVMFGSPRTVSGELKGHQYKTPVQPELQNVTVRNAVPINAQSWLDQFQTSSLSSAERDMEVIKVAASVKQKWLPIFEAQTAKITQARAQLETLPPIDDGQIVNPLRRDLQMNQQRIDEIQQLSEEIAKARTELKQLVAAAQADRQLIAQAGERDGQMVGSKIEATTTDPNSLTQILLQNQQQEYASEVVSWVKWFRNSLPNPEADFLDGKGRGANIAFTGQTARPRFLVKTLDLSGQGSLAGQHHTFAGVVTNMTNEPMLHNEPTTFNLRAQGNHHLIVDCTLDRREPVWKDRMVVKCPELDAPPQILGNSESLEIELANSRIQVDLDINVVDDQLGGTLHFSHSKCAMLVNQLHQIAGGDEVKLRMNQELLRINRFRTTATLGGTLDAPIVQFESDLGPKLAKAMDQIHRVQNEQRTAELRQRLKTRFDTELQQVDAMLNENFSQLAKLLDGEETRVAELLENLPQTERWEKIR